MPTAEQVKSLISSHFADDRERFITHALQMAAHEAHQGHSTLAHQIRAMVYKAKSAKIRIVRFDQEFSDLVITVEPKKRIQSLIVSEGIQTRIKRILLEYRQQHKIKQHGLNNRRKILLAGPPGTGKTLTAAVLASESGLSLHTILMDKLVTKFMGETSAKLRQIFNIIARQPGVYLFDEFDAIGGERDRSNDVGEMRRVLNSFLHFIDQDTSPSLIVAATNSPQILDRALFRRFDDILYYSLPTKEETVRLIENYLGKFRPKNLSLQQAVQKKEGVLSHAEITQACHDAIKEAILFDQEKVTADLLEKMLHERYVAHQEKAKQHG